MAAINKLTAAQVKAAPPGAKLGDGGGLRFIHDKRNRKYWEMRYQMEGKAYTVGCGGADTSLAEARRNRDAFREQIKEGRNPAVLRKLGTLEGLSPDATFEAVARAYVEAKKGEWSNQKHADQWLRPFEIHAAALWATPIKNIDIDLVLSTLQPLWHIRTETAKRIQQRAARIMGYAKVRRIYERDNPFVWAGYLSEVLASPAKIRPIEHFASMPYESLPSFWAYMTKSIAVSTDCLRFLILTAARSGEARGITWDEIDLKAKVWTLPPERMKGRKEHTVPLTAPAMAVLKRRLALREVTGNSTLVFPGARSGKVLSDVAVTKTLRRYGGHFTIHGMRSTFRDWAAEQNDHDNLAAEISLAHQDKDKVRAAYLRSDLFDKRRSLMAQWAKYVTSSKASKVTPMRSANV